MPTHFKFVSITALYFFAVSCSEPPPANLNKKDTKYTVSQAQGASPEVTSEDSSAPSTVGEKDTKQLPKPSSDVATTIDPNPPCRSIDWQKVTKPEDVFCLGSVDAVFSSFPEWVSPYFIFLKESRSKQKATLAQPRAVVLSPDGSFMIAASAHPGSEGDLEVAVYDYALERWDFAGINFTVTPPKVERDSCKACHGTEMHPIWTGYDNWPQAFANRDQLTKEEADFLQKAASGSSDTPPLLKHLKYQDASYYREGGDMRPASRHLENVNNQILNFTMVSKMGRSLTARILKDPLVTKSDIFSVIQETLCRTGGGTLERIGYPQSKYIFFGIEGKDTDTNPWTGFVHSSFHLGAQLLQKMLERDADLRAKLPEAVAIFNEPIYRFSTSSGPAEYLATRDLVNNGWYEFDFVWLQKPMALFRNGGNSCTILEGLARK